MGRRDVLGIMEGLRQRTTIFYSTHILDDVQRVADTVAILHRGRLVVQAPVSSLLAGAGHSVHALEFRNDARDPQLRAAHARLGGLPWVSDIAVSEEGGVVRWHVAVVDDTAAERDLLRTVLGSGPDLVVTAFTRRTHQLEEIFMQLVGEDGT
jgi:ABC-2 type transport system ATP-binding protein